MFCIFGFGGLVVGRYILVVSLWGLGVLRALSLVFDFVHIVSL